MSLHFTALDIFERTPSPVLQKALNRLRVPVPAELQSCTGPSSETAYAAFARLPQAERDKAEPWIGFVRELSDPDGRRVLGQLAARDRIAVPVDRESLKNATAVAVWFSAERPTLFEQALACRQYIGLSNRTLHERTDLPGAAADTSTEALAKLRTGLSKHFDTQEQRGGRVTVRTVPYGDGQTIYLAHIDDYPDCYPTHEGGRFGHRVIYPTFTVSYLFDAVRGSLAVNVAGGRPARRAVEACFFESVLGREYTPPPVGAVFRLAHLFDADQQFAPVAGGGGDGGWG